jgi:hypothetical protein
VIPICSAISLPEVAPWESLWKMNPWEGRTSSKPISNNRDGLENIARVLHAAFPDQFSGYTHNDQHNPYLGIDEYNQIHLHSNTF